ncbi:MAG: hypothetical protein FWD38_11405 [Oscillospiraceae bacterium]|nr:hypothetical protein [Oscillospiraceae bacterium]
MSKNTKKDIKQTRKHKQAQKSMETMVLAMGGTKKVKLQKPNGLKLTNNTQTVHP